MGVFLDVSVLIGALIVKSGLARILLITQLKEQKVMTGTNFSCLRNDIVMYFRTT
jgi:predicted nucleic acid-binding protein